MPSLAERFSPKRKASQRSPGGGDRAGTGGGGSRATHTDPAADGVASLRTATAVPEANDVPAASGLPASAAGAATLDERDRSPSATGQEAYDWSRVQVRVAEPMRIQTPSSEDFTVYKVRLSDADGNELHSCWRRFREFEETFRAIRAAAKEYGIAETLPELPKKKVLGRFSPKFVEERRRLLDDFLQRVKECPPLAATPDFRALVGLLGSERRWLESCRQLRKEQRQEKREKRKHRVSIARGAHPPYAPATAQLMQHCKEVVTEGGDGDCADAAAPPAHQRSAVPGDLEGMPANSSTAGGSAAGTLATAVISMAGDPTVVVDDDADDAGSDDSFQSCADWDLGEDDLDDDPAASPASADGGAQQTTGTPAQTPQRSKRVQRQRSLIVPNTELLRSMERQREQYSASPAAARSLGLDTPPATTPQEEESAMPKTVSTPETAPVPAQLLDLPADFASQCGVRSEACCLPSSDFSGQEEVLGRGGSLFNLVCNVGTALDERTRRLVARCVNLSGFEDEQRDNNVGPISMDSEEDLASSIFIISKAQYLLPGVSLDDFSPDVMEDAEYHRSCHPSSSKIWKPGESGWPGEKHTFRLTKTLIPFVLKMTVQFRCSLVPADGLDSLALISDGYRVHKALVLERTKRNKSVTDSTRKAKSMLLYHGVQGGGVLCTNYTCIVNSSLPTIAARAIDKFGSLGAGEVAQTAEKTRSYLFSELQKRKK